MSAFTILGLLVFWLWCFEIGMLLAFGAEALPVIWRVLMSERKIAKEVVAFELHLAEMRYAEVAA